MSITIEQTSMGMPNAGELQRARVLDAAGSNLGEFPLLEVTNSGGLGTGEFHGAITFTPPGNLVNPVSLRARAVTAQSSVSFDLSVSPRVTLGWKGWVIGGVLVADPQAAGANANTQSLPSMIAGNVFTAPALANAPAGGGGGFGGTNSITLRFVDTNSAGVAGVAFTLVGIGSAAARGDGTSTFGIPGGTYVVSALPGGGIIWPNTAISVTNGASYTIQGSAAAIFGPPSPSETIGMLVTRDQGGNPRANTPVTFKLVALPAGAAGAALDGTERVHTSDAGGNLNVTLLRNGYVYRYYSGDGKHEILVTPDASSFTMASVIVTDAP